MGGRIDQSEHGEDWKASKGVVRWTNDEIQEVREVELTKGLSN